MHWLPFSAARWQHGSQISLETFIKQKFAKILILTRTKVREKKYVFWILRILEIFLMRVSLSLKIISFLLNIISHRFLETAELLIG
jgi:hypothetical protein